MACNIAVVTCTWLAILQLLLAHGLQYCSCYLHMACKLIKILRSYLGKIMSNQAYTYSTDNGDPYNIICNTDIAAAQPTQPPPPQTKSAQYITHWNGTSRHKGYNPRKLYLAVDNAGVRLHVQVPIFTLGDFAAIDFAAGTFDYAGTTWNIEGYRGETFFGIKG